MLLYNNLWWNIDTRIKMGQVENAETADSIFPRFLRSRNYMYACKHVCTYARMPVCPYTRMPVCTYARIPVCRYARMHLCTYMHCTCILLISWGVYFINLIDTCFTFVFLNLFRIRNVCLVIRYVSAMLRNFNQRQLGCKATIEIICFYSLLFSEIENWYFF